MKLQHTSINELNGIFNSLSNLYGKEQDPKTSAHTKREIRCLFASLVKGISALEGKNESTRNK